MHLRNLLLVLTLGSSCAMAQPVARLLVAIEAGPSVDRAVLSAFHVPVYHRFATTVIAQLTRQDLESMRSAGLRVSVLDDVQDEDGYILLTRKGGELARAELGRISVVYEGAAGFIVRASSADVGELAQQNIRAARLRAVPRALVEAEVVSRAATRAMSDSLIRAAVMEVNPDTVRYFIATLSGFGSHHYASPNRHAVAEWIKGEFQRMGFAEVVLDTFMAGEQLQTNVVATLPASTATEDVIVIGGHHDTVGWWDPAHQYPGADDNSSGTAAVLEAARVLTKHQYQPRATLRFVTFAAEEIGLYGSFDYAAKAAQAGMKIRLMINHDMIATSPKPAATADVDVNYYTGAEHFRDLAKSTTEKYTTLTPWTGTANSSGSDSYSFWSYGYPAVYFEERTFSPVYHTPSDVIANCNIPYCAEVIRASVATLLVADAESEIPAPVTALAVTDVGDGHTLHTLWHRSPEPDITGYRVYLGRSAGTYDSSFTVTDTSAIVGGLQTGSTYTIAVAAYDIQGYEGFLRETRGTPQLVPLVPGSFGVQPLSSGIRLTWAPNREDDLAGYNLYRADSAAGSLLKLNMGPIADTSFTDASVEPHRFYWYCVRSQDASSLESPSSPLRKAQVASLDLGILLVDETADGSGEPGSPSDGELDEYYRNLVSGFTVTPVDLKQNGPVTVADMVTYSTVFWFGEDAADQAVPLTAADDLRRYLNAGGKFLYAGVRPSKAFTGSTASAATFPPGLFISDYLKISGFQFKPTSYFSGAVPLAGGYPSIRVDSAKAPAVDAYHIRTVEAIQAAEGGTAIYGYDSYYTAGTLRAEFKGRPVGVEYLGPDYKSVVLSFPLFSMRFEEARELVHYILAERFGETTGIVEPPHSLPRELALLPNYPNPFNPATTITFDLPRTTRVTLKVYDLLGREVTTLIDGVHAAGRVTARFDASRCASGVYICRLQTGGEVRSRSMMLLK